MFKVRSGSRASSAVRERGGAPAWETPPASALAACAFGPLESANSLSRETAVEFVCAQLPALKPYGEAKERTARLNPTLEAPDEFRPSGRKQTWNSGSRSKRGDPDSSFNPPIKTRSWENQADEVMADGTAMEKFRSLAVYADIKLQEALEKCNDITPAHVRDENAPDRFRAACCLQLLGELCMFVGPFEQTLGRIRDELALSIYSEYYTSEGGNLAFDQIPWFLVAEKLEAEKKALLSDREKFTAMLLQHQEAMKTVEAQMVFLQKKVTDLEAAAESAKGQLELAKEKEKKAGLEAQGSKEELKRARKDNIRLKDELAALKESSSAAQKEHEDIEDGLKLRMEHMKREVEDAEKEVKKAEKLRAGLVDAAAVEAAEKKIGLLELELHKYKERADEVRLERIKEVMTPRVNWKALDPFGEGEPMPGTSSKEIIKRMVKRLKKMDDGMPSKKEVEELKEAAAMLEDAQATAETALALLAPEPPMVALNWLQLTKEPQDNSVPIVRVKGFGKGPEVPRFLRTDGEVSFPEMSVGEAEAQVAALWRAKRESDGLNGRLLHVADFMYAWARKVAGSPEPERAVHAAYRLLVSCSAHVDKSPQIKLFMEVLSGRVGEAAMEDMAACIGGVAKLLRMLAGLGRGRGTFELTEEATDLITKDDFVTALEHFFPAKHEEKVKQLLDAAQDDNPAGDELDDRLKLAPLLEVAGCESSNFLRVLQEQYIEDIVAYSSQVKAAVKSLMPKDAANSRQNEVDMGSNDLRNALATVDNGFSERDVSNMLATGAGLAFGSLADNITEGGGSIDGAVFTARLQGMLVRPSKLWDTESALSWCADLRDGMAPDRGSASLGAQPDMA